MGKSWWGLKAAMGSEGQQLEAARKLASWQLDGKLFLDGRCEVMATTYLLSTWIPVLYSVGSHQVHPPNAYQTWTLLMMLIKV